MKISIASICFFSLMVIAMSCDDNPGESSMLTDNFDRGQMLDFWADEIIIPSYTAYVSALEDLDLEVTNFYTDPNVDRLNNLRSTWLEAYLTWQDVSMFEIGRAEEISLRNFTNIYPSDVDLIQSNIERRDYNLELPSNFDAQGFPALDYLFFGLADSDIEIVEALIADDVESYVTDLVTRLSNLSTEVLTDWNSGFREEFVDNSGSSASAATDKLVNDFLFYYERNLRAAKVGIPAGVFSGTEQPNLVEGLYSQVYSKELFLRSFEAVQDFFEGQSYDGQQIGVSLRQYLDDIRTSNATDVDIAGLIITQWEEVDLAAAEVGDSFREQVIEDNSKMLALYDQLQAAVVPLKVDMLSALNIQVDFVDADGD
jgi:predicted lipoprotein